MTTKELSTYKLINYNKERLNIYCPSKTAKTLFLKSL